MLTTPAAWSPRRCRTICLTDLCRTDSLFGKYYDIVLDSMQLEGVPNGAIKTEDTIFTFRVTPGTRYNIPLAPSSPALPRQIPCHLSSSTEPLPPTGPPWAETCLYVSDVISISGRADRACLCGSMPQYYTHASDVTTSNMPWSVRDKPNMLSPYQKRYGMIRRRFRRYSRFRSQVSVARSGRGSQRRRRA